jgi:hypothetical protein
LPQVPNQKRRKQHQRYVFFSLESPFHDGVDFNNPRYGEKELDFNKKFCTPNIPGKEKSAIFLQAQSNEHRPR